MADLCDDGTVERAETEIAAFRGMRGIVVIAEGQNVGAARRLGCYAALRHLSGRPLDRIWLAHTDADTAVPPSWISGHLDEADRGAVAVAGVVRVDSFDGYPADMAERFAATYRTAPDGTHPLSLIHI